MDLFYYSSDNGTDRTISARNPTAASAYRAQAPEAQLPRPQALEPIPWSGHQRVPGSNLEGGTHSWGQGRGVPLGAEQTTFLWETAKEKRVVVDCWNAADCLTKLAKALPYVSILLAILVAREQFFKIRVDSRIRELNKRAEAQRKNTPPSMDVRLGNSQSTRK